MLEELALFCVLVVADSVTPHRHISLIFGMADKIGVYQLPQNVKFSTVLIFYLLFSMPYVLNQEFKSVTFGTERG